MPRTGLVWLRADLRISDNPALSHALHACETVIALYVDETSEKLRPIGGAARAWLKASLESLSDDLARIGVVLHYREGDSATIIPRFAGEYDIQNVFWNRRYGPAERQHDAAIKSQLKKGNLDVVTFNGSLLVEPWDIATQAGKPFSVFTPFWKVLRERDIARPLPAPGKRDRVNAPRMSLPPNPAWAPSVLEHWDIGEKAAQERLERFLDEALEDYKSARDIPARQGTSTLSPYLRFGEISPYQVWHAVRHRIAAEPGLADAGEKFLSELAWRDFAYNLLFHNDDITRTPMRNTFADVEWREDADALRAWQKGRTGIPIIDAGMRQLWQTGWMHNRVRMLTASLLAKNLLIDWRKGEDWFWDTLVDADPGNNPASWQWVAGCGADAAPYFRIFNPVTQGEKFDPEGDYVRRWVPEIAKLSANYIHHPWDSPRDVLDAAEIKPGETYPHPLVDLKSTRARALDVLGSKSG